MGGLKLRDAVTCEERSLKVRGLFYGIGHSPNSQLLEGQIELDGSSYVVVEPGTTNTSVEGVYAAGDLQVCEIISEHLEQGHVNDSGAYDWQTFTIVLNNKNGIA